MYLLFHFVVCLYGRSENHHLNSSIFPYAFAINRQMMFNDNKRIPRNVAVSSFLLLNEEKRFYFLLTSPAQDLEFTLIPCDSRVAWSVTFKDFDKTISTDWNQPDNNRVKVSKNIVGDEFLHSSSGDKTQALLLKYPKNGIYTLKILATRSDSFVQFSVTTSSKINRVTEIQEDSGLNLTELQSKELEIAWYKSPDLPTFQEYCVEVSKSRRRALCTVHLPGKHRLFSTLKGGFGFSFESARKKSLRRRIKKMKRSKWRWKHLRCIGQNESFVFDRYMNGKKFHVNIFIRDKISGQSRLYKSLKVVNNGRKSSLLKSGQNRVITFSKGQIFKLFRFEVVESPKEVLIAINSCKGPMRVHVYRGNDTIYNSTVVSNIITLKRHSVGTTSIELMNILGVKQRVRLLFKTYKKTRALSTLPPNRRAVAFDHLTGCNYTTIAWMVTSKRQKICLYKTDVSSISKTNILPRLERIDHCGAFDRLESISRQITCKRMNINEGTSVYTMTVIGLSKNKSYIFDVFLARANHFKFPLGSVRIKTKGYGC